MMSKLSDAELISSYLDGEFDEVTKAQIENRLANDNEFANLFSEFSQNDTQLKNTFSIIDKTPVPSAILAMLEDNDNDLQNTHDNSVQVKEFNYKNWFVLAASIFAVVIILSLDSQLNRDLQDNLVFILSSEPSGKTLSINANDEVHLTMSFKDKNDNFCREYMTISAENSKHAVSCYIDTQWRQMISASIETPIENDYQLASGELSAEVESWLDENMESGPIRLDQ